MSSARKREELVKKPLGVRTITNNTLKEKKKKRDFHRESGYVYAALRNLLQWIEDSRQQKIVCTNKITCDVYVECDINI